MHVIGIDAGGTKTVCLLADGTGRVLAETRGGSANLHAVGELEVERVLRELLLPVLASEREVPSSSCIGIAGADRPEDADTVRAIMVDLGLTSPLVVNDALIALVAGVGHRPGVLVSAGTGSVAYGRDEQGRAARAGGWGYLLGDEGSGFWIGRAALAAIVRQFDGRGPATQLTELVLRSMGLSSPVELVHEIYDKDVHRHAVAGLAELVSQAAEAGDAVGADILARAASELGAVAAAVIGRLGMRGQVFPTVLSGGMFRGVPGLVSALEARIPEIAPRSEVRVLDVEPAVGAVRLALAAAQGQAQLPVYI